MGVAKRDEAITWMANVEGHQYIVYSLSRSWGSIGLVSMRNQRSVIVNP